MLLSFVNLKFFFNLLVAIQFCNALPKYSDIREGLIHEEELEAFGGKIILDGNETIANKCLMAAKLKELDKGYHDPQTFLPAANFLDVHDKIEKTEVFKMLRKMPKGAVFHEHNTAAVSLDFVIQNITYLPNLYICLDGGKVRFQFFEKPTQDCNWQLLKDVRAKNPSIDSTIREHLTLLSNRVTVKDDINQIWDQFQEIFYVMKGMIKYKPVMERYLYQALQELYDDNVMYVEFRSSFSKLYELNGKTYSSVEVVGIFKNVVDRFVAEHPNFLGAKFIHSPQRKVTQETFDNYVKTFKEVKNAYPNFILGFDLVGQEDKGEPLVKFADKLMALSKETKFFFHAGETNWYGHETDENLFDAVLLNTKRIGHGYALLKHPKLMEIVKKKGIAIELNPISNQVLALVKDLRNHPASYFFAENFPVVVSNDDPSYWGASGLSYDFYEAFMGIMSRRADLRALKQLAINSINYSLLTQEEKKKAFEIFKKTWTQFVKEIISDYNCS